MTDATANKLIAALNRHSDLMEKFITCTNQMTEPKPPPALNTPIEDLGIFISRYALKRLGRGGVHTLKDMTSHNWPQFVSAYRLNDTDATRIFSCVKRLGLQFQNFVEDFDLTANSIDPTTATENRQLPAEQRAINLLQMIGIDCTTPFRKYGNSSAYNSGVWLKQIITLVIEQMPNAVDLNNEFQRLADIHGLSTRQVYDYLSQGKLRLGSVIKANQQSGILPRIGDTKGDSISQLALITVKLCELGII